MPTTIYFDPNNQGEVATAAAALVSGCEKVLPKVPWFSNSGQQDAFRKIADIVSTNVSSIDANAEAKDAIIFWALTLLYANQKRFRLATASVKNWGAYGISPIVKCYIEWAGTNVHPGQAVALELGRRQMQEMFVAGIPDKIIRKTLEIARANGVSDEEASNRFQSLLAEAGKRHMAAGCSEYVAERKALEEILGLEPK